MTIYEKHFKTKQKIEALSIELDKLEAQILEEVKDLSAPMRLSFGVYTTASRKKYTFSPAVLALQKEVVLKMKEIEAPLDALKDKEVAQGIAKVEEIKGLRFIPSKK